MYFPSLKLLEEYNVDSEIIYKLDYWLGQLKGLKRKGIRPARFAVDAGQDFNTCNEVFSICAVKLKILQINYEIYSPYQNDYLVISVNNLNEIPERARCPETGKTFNPYDYEENIEITFDLIVTPDPEQTKNTKISFPSNTYKSIRNLKDKANGSLTMSEFLPTPLGKEEINNYLVNPNWPLYDIAYKRFIDSFRKDISTEEKGKALENLSCLSLSFIDFFRVDPTVHTNTNQIDVTVTVRPYFKHIEIPLLSVIGRRIMCECKNEDENVPSIWVDKLSAVIDKTDFCRTGILFSREKFSGDDWKFARATQLEHARLRKYIISINQDDFEAIYNNKPNILYYLDDKFEELEARITRRSL